MKLTWRVQGLVSCHQCLMTAPGKMEVQLQIDQLRMTGMAETVILEPQEIEVDQGGTQGGNSLDLRVLAPLEPFQRVGKSMALCGLRVP